MKSFFTSFSVIFCWEFFSDTYKFVTKLGQPGTNSGFLKNQRKTTQRKIIPTQNSCHVIGPSSLYFSSITFAATCSPCFPISMSRASLLFGLKRPIYITCNHNHIRNPISNITGTAYSIHAAKFIPELSGNLL